MERIANSIIKIRWIVILIVLGATVFFAVQLKSLVINSDILSTLPDDDPTALLYKEIGDQFGGNNIGMIVLETENVFTEEALLHIKNITESIEISEGVSTVTSLTNVIDIKSSEFGIEIGSLIDEYNFPSTGEEFDSLRRYISSKEMYKGSIVSEDGTACIILFTILPDADMQSTAEQIKSKIISMGLPEKLYFGGLPFMLNDITELIVADMVWLIPIVFIVIALILIISFRNFRGMVLPLLIAGITVIWTLGFMSLTGYEITIISNITPVVLLAISSAYAIHVLNSVNLYSKANKENALMKAISYTLIPVVLASVTTAVGFLSFVFGAYLTMIRDFGIITAVGIIVALFLSTFFVPAVISVSTKNKIANNRPESRSILSEKFLKPLVKIIFLYPRRILVFWLVLILLSIGGILLMKTSVNIADYFKKDNPTRTSEDMLQKKFGGSLPTFVMFEGDMQSPEVLNMMIRTEAFMKEDPNIASAQSIADLVEQMNDAMGEGLKIPDEKAKIEQLWFLLDGQNILSQLVTDDLDKGVIQSKFASIETDKIESYTTRMREFLDNNKSENFKAEFTGTPSLYVKLNDSLVKSQYSSLIIAILLVLLIVGLIMRSLSKGIYATTPIIATISVLLGFMGFVGIPLDIATVLVGSIALGIGIDYSIHMISGFNLHMKEMGSSEIALEKTILTTGKAVIINVASVAAGFLLLLFSQIVPLQNFGLLIAISMLGSGMGALTLLPAILVLANKRKTKI